MSNLTDFLLARIAEDEQVAHEADGDAEPAGDGYEMHPCHPQGWAERTGWVDIDPARGLAECQAKRRIVQDYVDALGATTKDESDARRLHLEFGLRHLTAIYSDHLDYREEWRT